MRLPEEDCGRVYIAVDLFCLLLLLVAVFIFALIYSYCV